MIQRKLLLVFPLALGVSFLSRLADQRQAWPPRRRRRPLRPRPPCATAPITAPAAAAPTTAAAARPTTAYCGAHGRAPGTSHHCSAAAAANAAGKPVKGGQLVVATARDATTFDPTTSQDVYSKRRHRLVTDSLYKLDDKAQVVGQPPSAARPTTPQPNICILTPAKASSSRTALTSTPKR